MGRLAVNLSMIFTEVSLIDRFALAHAEGFEHVEIHSHTNFPFPIFKTSLNVTT